MNNEEIFKYIDPTSNEELLKMKGYDLQDLLYYLDNYYLSLRDNVGIDKDITFGMELEFEQVNREHVVDDLVHHNLNEEWKVKGDGSLDHGGEIASPILKDFKVNWEKLAKVCSIVSHHAVIGEKAGGHIHIGTPTIGGEPSSWINFLKIWSIYENIIFRFVYGEYLTGREGINKYAVPMSNSFMRVATLFEGENEYNIFQLLSSLNREKYQAVNLNHVGSFDREYNKNTIEFRCPNGTLDPVIWQNNLNLFVKLLLCCKNNNFDMDTILKRKEFNDTIGVTPQKYNEIYLTQALEFADLIFNNNLDKVYFLRQYLKSYQCSKLVLDKAKPFTKTLN